MQFAPELSGLSSEQAREQIALGFTNQQNFQSSRSIFAILRANFLTLFNAVVGGAFLILLALGQWKDALFGAAVIANILIGVVQEYRSKRTLDRLVILSQSPVRVRRDGRTQTIRVDEVVQGDLLELGAGDQVPADALVVQSQNLQVDESLITGEAEPVEKAQGDQLLSGSGISGGRAVAVVQRVGADTYSSRLLVEARKYSLVASEIRNSLNRLIKWISFALGPIMVVVVYGQLNSTDDLLQATVRSIASIISMVPQGLVLIASISFAISAAKLARGRVLLQELAAVEGLARVDVVCFDKTGTLTGGAIELVDVFELGKPETIASTDWRAVLGVFAHQADANATARSMRGKFPEVQLPISSTIEFSSTRKWSAIEVNGETWKLGAPEVLTTDQQLLSKVTQLSRTGNRTLLLGLAEELFTPLVLLTFREEIRPEATKTLQYFRSQGVDFKVFSGDHPDTVAAIAKETGFEFVGSGVDALSLPEDPQKLADIVQTHSVFGRVTPEQKKQLINALQSKGHVVAMIGDGVNDALALKQADLGIAMGSGAAATRAVSNLVLIDNQFEALPSIVGEGRRVIANVERLARLFLTKTSWAMTLALVFGLMLWEFPFLPRQLSAVDGFTIGIPAFLLALLPNPKRYQPGFLKRALSFCIPAGLITALAVISLHLMVMDQQTWSTSEAQTATTILLSVVGLWVLSSLARPWSKLKLLILLLMIATAIGMFTLPATLDFFGFSVLTIEQLLVTFSIGFAASLGIETVNYLVAKAEQKNNQLTGTAK